MAKKMPQKQAKTCKTPPVAKGKTTAFYAPPSISAAKNFSINGGFEGSKYLTIALRCNQICENFLKGIKRAPEQKSPFDKDFNFSEKFCYIRVNESGKTIRIYRKTQGVFYMKEYSPKSEQSLQELYQIILSELAA